MTNVGEGVAVPQLQATANEPQEEKHSCDWKNCPTEDKIHEKQITYRNNGCTLRPAHPADPDYKKKLDNGHPDYYKEQSRWKKAEPVSWEEPRYHHLIPLASMEKYGVLSHNARLSGYDINHPTNIMALPYSDTDAKIHGIQAHRGNHKSYSAYVDKSLSLVDRHCKTWCRQDSACTGQPQSDALIARLDLVSRMYRTRIAANTISLK